MAKQMKALGENIILRTIKDEVSRGGIIVPQTGRVESPGVAEVVSIGPKVDLTDFPVKPGSKVQFDTFSTFDLGEGLVSVKVDNLLAYEAEAYEPKKYADEKGGVWVEDATSPTFARKVG